MVHIAKLVVALAGAAVVSAVPTPARRATVDVTPSGQQRSTAIKWWYKAGGIPDRNADSPAFRRRRGGRGGRGGSKGGKGGNGGGATTTSASQSETTSVAEDTASSSDAAETTSSAAETTDGAETTTAESTTEQPSETSTTETPQETEDPDQAIGDADTGLKDTIEVCREPDGKTLCFLILADTKNTCFLLPFPIAGDVEFFVPMPNATCTMFNNRDCDGDGVAGFGANDQTNMVAWSCQPKAAAITSTSAAPAETTTSAAAEETTTTEEPAETTTTDEAAETTTSDEAAETTTTGEAAETTTTDGAAETTTTDGAAETTTTDAPAETTTSEASAETTTSAGNGNGNGQNGTGKGNNGKGNNGKGNNGKGNNGKGNNGKGNVKPTKSQNGGPRNTSTGLSKPTKSTTKATTTKTSTGLAKPTKSTTKTTSTRSTPVRPTAVRPTTKTTARPTSVKTTKTSSAQFTKPTKTKSNTKNNTKTTTRGGAPTTSQAPASTTTPSVELDNPIPTAGGGGAQLGGNDEGGANGLTDTNKTNTIRACKGNNVGGNLGDDCIEILSDVASTCFSFPGQFTGEIGAFLPMPGGFCTLFTDDNCSSQETTTGFGTIQNKSQKSWSCSNTPPADDNAGNNGGNNNGNNNGNNGGNNGNADNGNNGNDNANNGGNNGNDNANNGGNNGNNDNANNDNANNGGNNNADNGNADNGNNGNADNGNNGNNGGNNDNSGALPEGNVSDFGTCTPPAISFGRNIKGRNPNELAFIATDTNAFPHDGALNIKVITDAMCLDLINRCGLKNGDAGVDACRRAEAAALQKPNDGSAADEFNRVIGTQTNFASVTRRSAKFRF